MFLFHQNNFKDNTEVQRALLKLFIAWRCLLQTWWFHCTIMLFWLFNNWIYGSICWVITGYKTKRKKIPKFLMTIRCLSVLIITCSASFSNSLQWDFSILFTHGIEYHRKAFTKLTLHCLFLKLYHPFYHPS